MPIKLKQIPLLLQIVRQFEKDNSVKPLISIIQKTFNNLPVREATFLDFNKVTSFCLKTGILNSQGNLLTLTNLGNEILKNYEENNSINDDLKQIFAKNCFLEGIFSQDLINVFSHFKNENHRLEYPTEILLSLFTEPEIVPLLYECEILELSDELVLLNQKYMNLIKIKKKEGLVRISQKHIDAQLDIMKKVGEIGEELVFDYEVKRLRDSGHIDESKNVQRISQMFANAGFDIKSFNHRAKDLNDHDKFIEVKASTNTEIDFHWSENEIKTAEELGEKYWLYFIGGIDIQTRTSSQIPLIIQDPFQNILKNPIYTTQPESYHVTKT